MAVSFASTNTFQQQGYSLYFVIVSQTYAFKNPVLPLLDRIPAEIEIQCLKCKQKKIFPLDNECVAKVVLIAEMYSVNFL